MKYAFFLNTFKIIIYLEIISTGAIKIIQAATIKLLKGKLGHNDWKVDS